MLKSFKIKNFQSHKELEVEFGPGVTTIVGPNDKGKSAFMRALQLVCLNKLSMSPDAYIRFGKNKLDLELVLDTGKVRRVKGKHNLYFLNDKRLEAFGKNKVPEKVEAFLNIGRENFQRQQDQHFWFSETPGEVSRKLNQMVNLGLVDKSLKFLAEESRATKTKLASRIADLKDVDSDLEALRLVPILDVKLRNLEKLEKRIQERNRNALELRSGVKAMQNASRGRKARRIALRAGKRALKAGAAAAEARKRLDGLQEAIRELRRSRNSLKMKIPDFTSLLELRERGDQLAERERSLRQFIEDLKKKEGELWARKGRIEKLRAKLEVAAKDRRCPMCGNPLSSQSSSEISTCRTRHRSHGKRKEKTGTR